MAGEKGLLGGSIELMILSLLETEDCYGYQMVKRLEEKSNAVFQMKEGTLYPLLQRMENKGYLASYEKEAENGKKRKYYRLTASGKRQLATEKEQWHTFTTAVNHVIGGKAYGMV